MAFAKQQHYRYCIPSSCETFSAIFMETEMVDLIFLYLSQNFDWRKLKELFDQWIRADKCVAIIGDVNIDPKEETHKFMTYMEENGFTQLVDEPTHDGGRCLDHIYVNEKLGQKQPFHSQRCVYYSDHDVITLHVPLENKS